MTVIQWMIERRRLERRALREVNEWRLTELQAWELGDEMMPLQLSPKRCSTVKQIVEAMKRGEIRVLGKSVIVE